MIQILRLHFLIIFLGLSGCASLFHKEVEKPHYWKATKDGTQVSILGTFHTFVSIHEIPNGIIDQLKTSGLLILEVPPVEATENTLLNVMSKIDRGIIYSDLKPDDFKFYKSLYKKSEIGRRFLQDKHHVEMDNYILGNLILLAYIEDQTEKTIEAMNDRRIKVKESFVREVNDLSKKLDYSAKLDNSLYKIAVEEDIVFDYFDRDLDAMIEIEKKSSLAKFNELFSVAKKIHRDKNESMVFYYEKLHESVRLVELYRSGQPVIFDNYINQILGKELRSKLLQKRNTAWANYFKTIDKAYDHIFIGIGAAHLYGTGNFLQALEKQGYTVTREKN